MKTFISEGSTINYTNAGGAISSGDIVLIGCLVGIAVDNIAANAVGPVLIDGKVQVTKTGSQAWTAGQRVYWDGSVFTNVATGNTPAGVATDAVGSGSGETTGYILLNNLPVVGATSAHIAALSATAAACAGGSVPTATQVDAAISTATTPIIASLNSAIAALQAARLTAAS